MTIAKTTAFKPTLLWGENRSKKHYLNAYNIVNSPTYKAPEEIIVKQCVVPPLSGVSNMERQSNMKYDGLILECLKAWGELKWERAGIHDLVSPLLWVFNNAILCLSATCVSLVAHLNNIHHKPIQNKGKGGNSSSEVHSSQ